MALIFVLFCRHRLRAVYFSGKKNQKLPRRIAPFSSNFSYSYSQYPFALFPLFQFAMPPASPTPYFHSQPLPRLLLLYHSHLPSLPPKY